MYKNFKKLCGLVGIEFTQPLYRVNYEMSSSPTKRETSDMSSEKLISLKKLDKTARVTKVVRFIRPFTSTAQLELMQLICENCLYMTLELLPYSKKWFMVADNGECNSTQDYFSEALAEVCCQLLELEKLSKKEVRAIIMA